MQGCLAVIGVWFAAGVAVSILCGVTGLNVWSSPNLVSALIGGSVVLAAAVFIFLQKRRQRKIADLNSALDWQTAQFSKLFPAAIPELFFLPSDLSDLDKVAAVMNQLTDQLPSGGGQRQFVERARQAPSAITLQFKDAVATCRLMGIDLTRPEKAASWLTWHCPKCRQLPQHLLSRVPLNNCPGCAGSIVRLVSKAEDAAQPAAES